MVQTHKVLVENKKLTHDIFEDRGGKGERKEDKQGGERVASADPPDLG